MGMNSTGAQDTAVQSLTLTEGIHYESKRELRPLGIPEVSSIAPLQEPFRNRLGFNTAERATQAFNWRVFAG